MARQREQGGVISRAMSDRWYRALASKDARFDGVFFVGVTTTGITYVFPKAEQIAQASLEEIAAIGMPRSRALSLKRLASEMVAGLKLEPGVPVEPTLTRLMEVPGIGEWTAQYLAMRALSWPDAFPASDLGVLKGLGVRKASESLKIAEAFRPWRAYATLHLWSSQ
jgi:AraC family transcriptional regulator of adaptative response / DNA-3-methyladenine glycosylase II